MTLPESIAFDTAVQEGLHGLSPRALIEKEFGHDPDMLRAGLKQWEQGEPAPYVVGAFYFRGIRFRIDERAYITDPEASYLVDTVAACAMRFQNEHGRPPRIAEFGTGAGTLSLSLKPGHPGFVLSGLDVDPAALEVARDNARILGVDIDLFESDYFSGWGNRPAPDILFADPPWGSRTDLYGDERDAAYYDRMPARSAYPVEGGRIGLHLGILRHVQQLNWNTLVIMNLGVIPAEVFAELLPFFRDYSLYQPTPDIHILCGFLR